MRSMHFCLRLGSAGLNPAVDWTRNGMPLRTRYLSRKSMRLSRLGSQNSLRMFVGLLRNMRGGVVWRKVSCTSSVMPHSPACSRLVSLGKCQVSVAKVHRAMAVHRHRADREFFRVDINNAVRYIQAECPSPEHVWSRQPVIPVFESGAKPKLVECERCGAGYFWAIYCPKCGIKLAR